MDGITNEEMRKKYAKIVAKAWADDDYKKKLIENPKEILKQEGIVIPDNIKIRILENSETKLNFILPPKPDNLYEINQIDEKLAAGSEGCSFAGSWVS